MNGFDCVVVSTEWVERSYRLPTRTQLLVRVSDEAADVGANERNSKHVDCVENFKANCNLEPPLVV